MAEQSDAADRVNSLMRPAGKPPVGRRRRSFVAAPADAVETTIAPLPANEDEDLPVLTDVVPAEITVSAPPADHFDETLLSIIASDFVHCIEQQLAIELPMLIEATLINAQNELRTGINSTLDMALRDFLARRQQLRLPLDEPNRDA